MAPHYVTLELNKPAVGQHIFHIDQVKLTTWGENAERWVHPSHYPEKNLTPQGVEVAKLLNPYDTNGVWIGFAANMVMIAFVSSIPEQSRHLWNVYSAIRTFLGDDVRLGTDPTGVNAPRESYLRANTLGQFQKVLAKLFMNDLRRYTFKKGREGDALAHAKRMAGLFN